MSPSPAVNDLYPYKLASGESESNIKCSQYTTNSQKSETGKEDITGEMGEGRWLEPSTLEAKKET